MRVLCSPEPAPSPSHECLRSSLQMDRTRPVAACLPFPREQFSGINWLWAAQPSGFFSHCSELRESPALLPSVPTCTPRQPRQITYVGRAREVLRRPGALAASVLLCREHSTAFHTPKQALEGAIKTTSATRKPRGAEQLRELSGSGVTSWLLL